MSNEFRWDDEEKFKKKFKIQIFLCFVLFLLLLGLHVLRNDSVLSLSNKYNDIKTKEQWLEQYQSAFKGNVLEQAMQPVSKDQLEAARQTKANLFINHKLKIDNIVNSVDDKHKAKQGMETAESSANVEGSWSNLCGCLAEFTKNNLSAVTGITIDSKNGGLLKARLTYKIFYR